MVFLRHRQSLLETARALGESYGDMWLTDVLENTKRYNRTVAGMLCSCIVFRYHSICLAKQFNPYYMCICQKGTMYNRAFAQYKVIDMEQLTGEYG